MVKKAGQPYCTIRSKMSLVVGIATFVLLHEDGICTYDTKEDNLLSNQSRLNTFPAHGGF